MKLALVLTFDVAKPEDVPDLIRRIDPPGLPGFDDQLRVVVDTDVDDLKKWLDEPR